MTFFSKRVCGSPSKPRHFVSLVLCLAALAWCAMPYNQVIPVVVPVEEFPVQFYMRQIPLRGYPFVLQNEVGRSAISGMFLNIVFWILLMLAGELIQRQFSRQASKGQFRYARQCALFGLCLIAFFWVGNFIFEYAAQARVLATVNPDVVRASDAIPSAIRASFPNHTGWFRSAVAVSCEASDLAQLSSISTIKMIELRGDATDSELEQLQNFPHLVCLTLDYVSCRDDAIDTELLPPMLDLPPLPRLQSLTVTRSAFSGKGISSLLDLRRIALIDTSVDNSMIDAILRLNKLQRFVIYGYELNSAQREEIAVAIPECVVLSE